MNKAVLITYAIKVSNASNIVTLHHSMVRMFMLPNCVNVSRKNIDMDLRRNVLSTDNRQTIKTHLVDILFHEVIKIILYQEQIVVLLLPYL